MAPNDDLSTAGTSAPDLDSGAALLGDHAEQLVARELVSDLSPAFADFKVNPKIVEALAAYRQRIAMGGWDEEVYQSMLQVALLSERIA